MLRVLSIQIHIVELYILKIVLKIFYIKAQIHIYKQSLDIKYSNATSSKDSIINLDILETYVDFPPSNIIHTNRMSITSCKLFPQKIWFINLSCIVLSWFFGTFITHTCLFIFSCTVTQTANKYKLHNLLLAHTQRLLN